MLTIDLTLNNNHRHNYYLKYRLCKFCNNLFLLKIWNQRYCNSICKLRWRKTEEYLKSRREYDRKRYENKARREMLLKYNASYGKNYGKKWRMAHPKYMSNYHKEYRKLMIEKYPELYKPSQ